MHDLIIKILEKNLVSRFLGLFLILFVVTKSPRVWHPVARSKVKCQCIQKAKNQETYLSEE